MAWALTFCTPHPGSGEGEGERVRQLTTLLPNPPRVPRDQRLHQEARPVNGADVVLSALDQLCPLQGHTTRKHLGTKLRLVDPVPCVKRVFGEMTSTQRGVVIESLSEGIERRTSADYPQRKEGRPLLACKQSAMRDLYMPENAPELSGARIAQHMRAQPAKHRIHASFAHASSSMHSLAPDIHRCVVVARTKHAREHWNQNLVMCVAIDTYMSATVL